MAQTGRPPIEIDQKQFENLCSLHCTLTDIAGWFECSEVTVQRWCRKTYNDTFEGVYKRFLGRGNASLRRTQMKLAEKSATMCIWLGKQYLGQKDKPEEAMTIIESQDGMIMANADSIGMVAQTGDDQSGYQIVCEINGNQFTLGNYATADAAGYVLGEIKEHMTDSSNYKLPRDEGDVDYDY